MLVFGNPRFGLHIGNQPIMTTPNLAEKMQALEDDSHLQVFCDEIIHLIRAQLIAVFGNIISIIPISYPHSLRLFF